MVAELAPLLFDKGAQLPLEAVNAETFGVTADGGRVKGDGIQAADSVGQRLRRLLVEEEAGLAVNDGV